MVLQLPYKDPSPMISGLYETDLYNQMPIFLIKKEINYFVRSWEEAFALHGKPSLEDINPNYLRALIYREHSTMVSPYKRIIRIPKSSKVIINSDFTYQVDKKQIFKINNLSHNKNQIFDNINNIFIRNLKKIIDNNKENIGCELSGGLDSNTILGVIKKENLINSKNLYTFSNAANGESELINIAINHHNIDINNLFIYEKFNKKSDFDFDEVRKLYLVNLGFLPQIGILPVALNKFKEFGVKAVLSGFGGDQCISHHGLNIATDYIKNLQLSKLYDFYDMNFQSLKKLIFRLFYIANPGSIFLKEFKIKNKYENFLINFLTSKGKNIFNKKNRRFINWENNYYCDFKNSIVNRISADWVSSRIEEEVRMYKSFGIKKFYPFLNIELISYILSLNLNNLISDPFVERSIIKNFFNKYIPITIIDRNKNQINNEVSFENLRRVLFEDINQNLNHLNNLHEKIYDLFNITMLEHETYKILNNPRKLSNFDLVEIRRGVSCINSLNFWFHSLSDK